MPTMNEILSSYKNLEYSELLKRAKGDYEVLLPVFSKLAKDNNGRPYVLIFIGSTLAADGILSPLEYKFVSDLFGYPKEDIEKLFEKHKSEKAMTLADRVFDMCNEQMKELLLDFCLCFLAVDKDISPEERAFIARLLA